MTAWLTTEDEQNYGRDLLDVSQRAALHAVAPAIQDLQKQGAELQRQLAREARRRPTYTHEQIGQLYSAHRRGAYAGREAEWARIEADIFRAQREGRVVGAPYLTK